MIAAADLASLGLSLVRWDTQVRFEFPALDLEGARWIEAF